MNVCVYSSRPSKLYRKPICKLCLNVKVNLKNDHSATSNQIILSGKGYQWIVKLIDGILLVPEYCLTDSLLIANRKMCFNGEIWQSPPLIKRLKSALLIVWQPDIICYLVWCKVHICYKLHLPQMLDLSLVSFNFNFSLGLTRNRHIS